MEVRLLYAPGCPGAETARNLLNKVMSEEGVRASVRETVIDNIEDATRYQMLGSPSVQIDGRDIEPARRGEPASMA